MQSYRVGPSLAPLKLLDQILKLPPTWNRDGMRRFKGIDLHDILDFKKIRGCSLNIVFFLFFKYSGLWPISVFPRCQCVYTHQAGRKLALQQNWQSSEKSYVKEKHNI